MGSSILLHDLLCHWGQFFQTFVSLLLTVLLDLLNCLNGEIMSDATFHEFHQDLLVLELHCEGRLEQLVCFLQFGLKVLEALFDLFVLALKGLVFFDMFE